jgi:lipopolysaccharide exporter
MKEKLAKGVLWLSGAKVLVNIMALSSTFVLARLLTPEDFGLVAIATTLLSVIGPVTELSLGSALIQHQNPTDEHYHSAWTMSVLRALVVGGLFCAAGPMVASFYKDPRLVGVMLAIGLSVAMGGFTNPKLVALTRNLEFWPSFVVAVAQKLLGFVVGVSLAVTYGSYWALLGGTLASQLANVWVSYYVQPYKPRFSLAHAGELWSFSVWLTLGQIVNTLNWRLDHLMVATFLGPKSLGTYVVGDNLASLPTREAAGPIEQTLFPGFRAVNHDRDQLVRTYQRAQALISAIALPVGFGCAVTASTLVPLVLGPKWPEAVLIVQVLSCIFALQTLSSTVHPLALAEGATKMMFQRDLVAFVIRVPIIIFGMWAGGMVGIVFARMVTGLIAIAINMYVVKQLIGLTLVQQVGNTTRSLISVFLMSGCLLAAAHVAGTATTTPARLGFLLAMGALGAAVYLASHFLIWRLAGKPTGAETDLLGFGRKAYGKLATRLI